LRTLGDARSITRPHQVFGCLPDAILGSIKKSEGKFTLIHFAP